MAQYWTDGVTLYDKYYCDKQNDWVDATAEEASSYEIAREAIQAQSQAKQAKVEALDKITVTTTAGNTFDGRDKDQLRMLAALQSSQFLGLFNTPWKLSDNSVIQVSVEELREALALSIQATGNIIIGGTV